MKNTDGDSTRQAVLSTDGKITSDWYNSITARGCSFIAEKGEFAKEKRALLDKKGKVISDWYDHLLPFELTGTFITTKNGGNTFDNHGLIDRNGRELLPPKYNTISCKRKHILAYTTPGNIVHYTLFDTAGKKITDAPVIAIYDDNDLVLVSRNSTYAFYRYKNGAFTKVSDDYETERTSGSIRTAFRVTIKKDGTMPYGNFSEGLCSVKKNGKYGYIDASGKEVIKPVYDWALPFSKGRAEVTLNGRKLYIDNKGEEVK